MKIEILNGDALSVLKTLKDCSVQLCVTSPPYYGLRNYEIERQIGLEKTPEIYVQKLVEIFREVRRILKKDGLLWLNLGDSYASHKDCKSVAQTLKEGNKSEISNVLEKGLSRNRDSKMLKLIGLKNKDLIGIPWAVAFALRADGWYLRQDIIWNKTNCMPESVIDRCTKSHEYIFLLSKSQKYFYDKNAISESAKECSIKRLQYAVSNENKWRNGASGQTKQIINQSRENYKYLAGKSPERFTGSDHLVAPWSGNVNKRSVWTMPTACSKDAHFAVFPLELPETCIKAGSKENDTVLDPFCGSGTTGVACVKWRRNFIGIELNLKYVKIAEKRIEQADEEYGVPLFKEIGLNL